MEILNIEITIGIVGFVFVLVFAVIMIFFVFLGRLGIKSNFRSIRAYNKLIQAVDESIEEGKQVHISLGWGGLLGIRSAATFLGLNMMKSLVQETSLGDHPAITSSGESLQDVLSRDIIQSVDDPTSLVKQNNKSYSQITGLTPFSYTVGTIPLIYNRNVSVNLLTGHFRSEVALITDSIENSNSSMVAGSDNLISQAVMYASAQEALVGEELYAGGAYLREDHMQNASLRTQDLIRWILIVIIILGAILRLSGSL